MKKKILKSVLTLLFCLLLGRAGTFAYGQADPVDMEKAPDSAAPAMSDEMMMKWKEYSTPNENHQILSSVIGSWTYTSKNWMTPDSPADESSGTAEAGWIMDGRFVEVICNGMWMGQPFTGRQVIGYDNAEKQYVSTWFDNMGTGILNTMGSYDPATRALTQTGSFNCPFKGKMAVRWVTTFIDESTYSFEMYSPDETGKEFKGMEIIYKKK